MSFFRKYVLPTVDGLFGTQYTSAAMAEEARNQQGNQYAQTFAHQQYMDLHGAAVRASDFKAAGINPIVAASGGSGGGAPSPGGVPGSLPSPGVGLAGKLEQMTSAAKNIKEANMYDSQSGQLTSQSGLNEANSALAEVNAEVAYNIGRANFDKIQAETESINSELPYKKAKSDHAYWTVPVEAGSRAVGNVVGAATSASRAHSAAKSAEAAGMKISEKTTYRSPQGSREYYNYD